MMAIAQVETMYLFTVYGAVAVYYSSPQRMGILCLHKRTAMC